MQHNTKFDEAYDQAFSKANWSAIVRYMQVTHINADENGAKKCANQAYANMTRRISAEPTEVGGVRVEFFVSGRMLVCRISFNPAITEILGHTPIHTIK